MSNGFCKSCGQPLNENAEICPGCGVRQKTIVQKNPGLAAILSFFWTGAGQIYNGQIGKGLAFMVLQVINAIAMLAIIGFVTFPIVWALAIYDAYKVAEKINNGEA